MDSGAHAPESINTKKIFKNIKITQVSAEGLKINSRLREVNTLAGMASLIMKFASMQDALSCNQTFNQFTLERARNMLIREVFFTGITKMEIIRAVAH